MADEETPWPGDTEAPEDETQDGSEYPRWRGLISEWKPPGPKGGPARFKIGRLTAQVWPYEYGDEEKTEFSETFQACKSLAFDGAFVEAYGKEEPNTFYSEKAQKDITTTQRTVYGIEKSERMDSEDDPKPVGPAAKAATRGKAPRSEGAGGKYKGLTPEQWDAKEARKNQDIDAWAALKIVVPILYSRALAALPPGSSIEAFRKAEPTIGDIKKAAAGLIEVKRQLAPDSLSSTSDSAKASLPSTSAPDAPSAPVAKAKAPSTSAKPKKN